MVAIFVMDTEIREIALEENDELSHEVDAIVGDWDILEFYYKCKLVTNMCIEMSDSHLTSKFKYTLYP